LTRGRKSLSNWNKVSVLHKKREIIIMWHWRGILNLIIFTTKYLIWACRTMELIHLHTSQALLLSWTICKQFKNNNDGSDREVKLGLGPD
jgi:hypothetical protein